MSLLRALFFVVLSALAASAAGPDSRLDCSQLQSHILKRAVRYCALLPASYDATAGEKPAPAYPVLYYLHGLGDNERSLINTGAWSLIDSLRQQQVIGDFLIVTPEGDRSFYINSADGKQPYGDFFLREFMPAIERKYRVKPGRANRAITGMSMGGFGALRLAFAYPRLFSSVSAQSAALVTGTPQEFNAALRPGTPLAEMFGGIFGIPVNMQHWHANDPFLLAQENRAPLASLAIYFNCGRDDDYGFENGAAALHQRLKKEGIKHEFHLYAGNHSLTYFLTHLPEALAFHSHAFAAAR